MTEDAKLRTAAGLSSVWDGDAIKRVRALDGFAVLPGRRVAMHLMVQPNVGSILFGDRLLADQGLMSRVLVTAPEAASGTRLWREPSPDIEPVMNRYGARLLEILEKPLPFADVRGELKPRTLRLSPQARSDWIGLYNYIERLIAPGGELEPIRGLANKLPEHATRLAAVLALVNDIDAAEVSAADIEAGILLAQHYAAEAMRLFGAGQIDGDLHEAQRLLNWLQNIWPEPTVSLPDIYQRGPNSVRDAKRARHLAYILVDHGYLAPLVTDEIGGPARRRQEVWQIIGK
jgi:Protein of unknown function (DUF3987)